jgi:hypothetical protein
MAVAAMIMANARVGQIHIGRPRFDARVAPVNATIAAAAVPPQVIR